MLRNIQIDDTTKTGKLILEYVKKLSASKAEVKVTRFRKLTDEEMAIPGMKPTQEQFNEWLHRPDGESFQSKDAEAWMHAELLKKTSL